MLTSILVKIGANLAKFLAQSSAQFLSMGKEAEALKITENQIQNLLIRRPDILQEVAQGTRSIRDLEKDITASLDKGNAELQLAVDLSKSMADNLQRGARYQAKGALPTGGASGGFIPNFNIGTAERKGAAAAGYSAGDIKQTNIKGVGNVVYNNRESLVKFPGFEQSAIIPPFSSEAGKNYQSAFMRMHGFDPYAASGFVPNFNLGSVGAKDILASDNEKLKAAFKKELKSQNNNTNFALTNIRKSHKSDMERLIPSAKARQAGELEQKELENLVINANQTVGLLSLYPTTKGKRLGKTSRRIDKIPALAPQAESLGLPDKAKITMQNIAIRDASDAFRFGEGQTTVKNNFTDAITDYLSDGVGGLVNKFFGEKTSAFKLKKEEIQKRVQELGDSGRLLNAAAEAALFEQTVKIAATPGDQMKKLAQSSDKSAFDFLVDKNFRNVFDYGTKTQLSDAKRNASEDMASAISKSVNYVVSGGKKLPRIAQALSKFDASAAGEVIAQATADEKPKVFTNQRKRKGNLRLKLENRRAASGFVPNFL